VPELPNILTILAAKFPNAPWAKYLFAHENIIFSLLIVCALVLLAVLVSRKQLRQSRLQAATEVFVAGFDDFVCGILGPSGRKYTPFIGTLFIYITCMNLCGIVPLMKSSTTSWSTTLALALCVFGYVQYASIREHGFIGYVDHLMGRPRGFLAATVVIPILMLFLHVFGELVRPISLSLRLRSNIWGDDMLLAIVAGFGLKGIPIMLFNTFLVILAGLVQAVVFCLLSTIYFALTLTEE
jgi:F-type H+-transporting ATPase subunit a